jgi:hypothetical protein
MKNLNFIKIIAILVSTLFMSCAKDDEVPPSLIGKWEFDKFINYDNFGVAQPIIDSPFNVPGCTKSYLEFKPNNLLTFGIYNGSGCALTANDDRYVSDGKIIQLNLPFPSLATITTLTNTDLVLDLRPLDRPVNDPNNFIIGTLTFKRIQ